MNDALRLAVDARDVASDTRGIGRYVRAILRRLILRSDVELTLLTFGPFAFRHRRRLRETLGSDRFRIATRARAGEVLWHPSNGSFFSGAPSVATIHDTVPFRFPKSDARRRNLEQAPFLRSVRTAARVIAVSAFDRDELLEVFSLPPDRVTVIHHGVDPVFCERQRRERTGETPYLLFVGDPYAEARKNFALLHSAYRQAFPEGGPPLRVVGPTDPELPDVQYAGLADGDAAGGGDEHLAELYRGALALCVPSYYETFGMPMAEAMACGTPIIASRASCLPEIGGEAPLFAAPHSTDEWAHALSAVAESADLRERLRRAGSERARLYDWETSARRHLEVFRSL